MWIAWMAMEKQLILYSVLNVTHNVWNAIRLLQTVQFVFLQHIFLTIPAIFNALLVILNIKQI